MLAAARRSLGFLSRGERITYFTLLVLRALVGILDVIGIFFIGLIAAIAASQVAGSSAGAAKILGFTIPTFTPVQMLWLVVIVLGVFVGKALASILLMRALTRFVARIEARSAIALAEFLLLGSLENVRQHSRADLQYSITDSMSWAFTGVLNNVANIASEGFLLLLLAISFFVVSPLTALVVLAYFGLIIAGMQFFIGRTLKRAGNDAADGTVGTLAALTDTLDTFRELSVLGRQGLFLGRIRQARTRVARSGSTLALLAGMPRYVIETSLIVGVVLFIGVQVITGNLTTGLATLGVFLAGGVRVMGSLLPLQTAIAALKINTERSKLAQAMLGELRDNPIEPVAAATTIPVGNAGLPVAISHVDYRYADADRTLLDVTLAIDGGDFVAVVGPSGAGKTTLVDLVLGLSVPETGTVRIGGVEPRALRAAAPGLISYVPQKPGLVAGTIAENIALGVDPAEIDRERIREVVEAAFLTDFLASLPDGVDSSVGTHADALSGGQVQRIGLARALYVRPRLIVLDEATSGLDAASEAFIGEGLRALHGDVTVVVIAHRLSTVQHADVVHVLEAGRIVSSGTFRAVRKAVPMIEEYVKLMSFDEGEA
ncbi:MAG TPA: ABC transporter ATP-binding protein [Galbitalea sp.]|jgi:ATP-binding cassette subfamily C protein|nr:ABC transporter ATP-binding protein [Galbitalea sp.]